MTRAEIIGAFEGKKMEVEPFHENWDAVWILQGNKMDVVACQSQYETFSVTWKGDQMCLGDVPFNWSADGCYTVHSEDGTYILRKNGKDSYAKLSP